MRIMVSLLKFPPDFTGAGLRIEKMYTRLLNQGKVDEVFVITTSSKDLKEQNETRGKMHIFFVGKNAYIAENYSRAYRIKKLFYVLLSAWMIIGKYFQTYKDFDVIHTIDSSWVSTLVGWLAFLTRKPLIKEIILIGTDDPFTIKKEKGWLLGVFFLLPFNCAELIITISDQLKDICINSGFNSKKIWSRHNPVYVENNYYDKENIALNLKNSFLARKNVLFVGTIIKRKNIDFLLEVGKFLKGDVDLLFAGPEEDAQYYQYLQILAKRLQEETDCRIKVSFLGWIQDRKKLTSLFVNSDLFWFASSAEGMGNVIIESLLCGTPVVTLPVCGIMRKIIQSPEEGKIVENAIPQIFAEAVNHYLYEHKLNRQSLIKKARMRFDPGVIEGQYLTHFERLGLKR